MVVIRASGALALMAIALPIIQATPAIPSGESMEDKSETRIPVVDYLLDPSIPTVDGIDRIIDVMKKEKEEKAIVSRAEPAAARLPWGRLYLNREKQHIPDDDDDSERHEMRSHGKVKRDVVEGVVDDTGSGSAYETVHYKTLDTNETTTANEPRYNRMEQYAQRPALLHGKVHKVVPQIEKAKSKHD